MTDFLFHLGWLSLSMSAIILLVLLFYKVFGQKFTAKSRYTVWTVIVLSFCVGTGLFRLPAVFTLEIQVPAAEYEIPIASEKLPAPSGPLPSVTELPTAVTPAVPNVDEDMANPSATTLIPGKSEREETRIDIPTLLFTVWLLGAVLSLTFSFAVYFRSTQQYAKTKQLCDSETEELFRAMCRRYSIKRLPILYRCPDVGSPAVYGYTNPTVLLPELSLSKNSLVGIFAHELTHYRRGDLWVKLACIFAESLHWFNPLVYIAASRCNAEMELSCDESVLAGMDEDVRRSYGNVMLEIVKHCSRRRSTLTTRFNPHKNAVKERILNILDMTKKKRGRILIAAVLVLCILAGTILGCTIIGEDSRENDQISENHTVRNEIEKKAETEQPPANENTSVPQEFSSPYLHVEAIPALPQDPDTAWKIYDPMMTPIYYFFDKGLTYYCRYEYQGEHHERNTLILPEGHTNGEIFYVRGTGGSAEMYIIVKTDQGYLRYYSSVNHYPDEILSVTKMTEDEVDREKEYMANENLQSYVRLLTAYLHEPFSPGEAQYPDTILGLVYEYCFCNKDVLDGVTLDEENSRVRIDGELFRTIASSLFGDDFTVDGRNLVGGQYDEANDQYTTSYAKDYWGGNHYTVDFDTVMEVVEKDNKVTVTAMVGVDNEVYGIYVPFRPLEYTFQKVNRAGYWHYQIEKIHGPDSVNQYLFTDNPSPSVNITAELPADWTYSDDHTYRDTDGIKRLQVSIRENRSAEDFRKEIEDLSPSYACDMNQGIEGTTLAGHPYIGYTLDGVGSLSGGRATTQIYRFRFEITDTLSVEMDFFRRKDYDMDARYYENTIPPILASVTGTETSDKNIFE